MYEDNREVVLVLFLLFLTGWNFVCANSLFSVVLPYAMRWLLMVAVISSFALLIGHILIFLHS